MIGLVHDLIKISTSLILYNTGFQYNEIDCSKTFLSLLTYSLRFAKST